MKIIGNYKLDGQFDLCCERALNRTKKYRRDMVDYFETKKKLIERSKNAIINITVTIKRAQELDELIAKLKGEPSISDVFRTTT